MNTKHKRHEENNTKGHHKLFKINDKEKILKTSRKKDTLHTEKHIRMKADLSLQTKQSRRQWSNTQSIERKKKAY